MNHPHHRWATLRPGKLLPVFFLSLFFGSNAQGTSSGAYSLARGEVCVVGTEEALSIFNPALLSKQRSAATYAGHSRPFAIAEIGVTSLCGILPVYPGSFRLRFSEYGITGYRDLTSELAYGLELTEHLSAGISFQYYNTISQGDWNYLWTIGCGAGLIYAPSDATRTGIVLLNPVTVGNHSCYGPLFPAMIAAGVAHTIYENMTLLAEFCCRNQAPVQVKFGVEYLLKKGITLACGAHSSPATYAFGARFGNENYSVHFASAWSPLPGIHPSILVSWLPGK